MRKWISFVAILLAILLMLGVIYGIGRGVVKVLGGIGKDAGEPDPMYDPFSGGLSRETRPPQLAGEDEDRAPVAGDQSDSWVYEELNPVDMTASELAEAEK